MYGNGQMETGVVVQLNRIFEGMPGHASPGFHYATPLYVIISFLYLNQSTGLKYLNE